MTTQHRALVQQMLEALEYPHSPQSWYAKTCKESAAITAARAYLAAPEQSEPVAWMAVNKSYKERRVELTFYPKSAWFDNHEITPLYTATPQPTTPEPVNQMLLSALNELLECVKYGAVLEDADAWIDARAAIAKAEQAPQPTELTDEEIRAIVYDTRYNGIYDTVRACIAAAQKGTK